MTAAVREEKVSLLLVDDRPGNLLSLEGILERPDYDLVTCTSGEAALGLLLRQEFAVILLDVAMPGIDGFEVATTLKQRERFRTIPIIFVTASVDRIEWIFKAYSVGAVDFLQKPLDPHAVRAKVAVFVELYRQRQELRRYAEKVQEIERRERALEVARLRIESEHRYRHLAEAIPHVVWTADGGGQIQHLNQRWSEVTGMSLERSLGDRWRAAVHPDDAARFEASWAAALRLGEGFQVELRLRRRDGAYPWHLCRALPEKDASGRVLRWVGTLTDVDEEKRAHDELQATLRLRDEFLSVASHELRTPISTLKLQLQGLQRQLGKGAAAEDGRLGKKAATALRQTDRLSKLVDSLLDVSRIARGDLDLQLEELDLADAVRDVAERFREEAVAAGCDLRLALDPGTGRWDRLRMEQVLTNLIANSIKYAPGRPIRISVRADDDVVSLVVQDEGIGIDPEQVDRIFERFERAVPIHRYAGLGLGLYIVRQIVQAHGGRVAVASRQGVGSTFVIRLPRRPCSATGVVPEYGPTEHANDQPG